MCKEEHCQKNGDGRRQEKNRNRGGGGKLNHYGPGPSKDGIL